MRNCGCVLEETNSLWNGAVDSHLVGSGKSSISKSILSHYASFHRLSIDVHIYKTHGLYGVDYPAEKYGDFQQEAEEALHKELSQLLQQGAQNVILDFSFAFQHTRDEWKDLIESLGGRWVLVYLDVSSEELHRRVAARNQLAVKDADSAYPVTREVLERYLAGFEKPTGEGEITMYPGSITQAPH